MKWFWILTVGIIMFFFALAVRADGDRVLIERGLYRIHGMICDEQAQAEHILAVHQKWGWEKAKVLYEHYSDLSSPRKGGVCHLGNYLMLLGEKVASFENIKRKDGSVVTVHIIKVSIGDEFTYYLLTDRDVVKRERYNPNRTGRET